MSHHLLQRPAGGVTRTDRQGRPVKEPDVQCPAYRVTADTVQWVPQSRAHIRANSERCGKCSSQGKCRPPCLQST